MVMEMSTMKACINKKCPDKFVGGSVWDRYCPRCGKLLYDTSDERVKRLVDEGHYT